MNPHILQPRKALYKAYLKVKPVRSDIEKFKSHLIGVLDQINEAESEEFHKNLLSDFLKKTYYDPAHSINTKGRNDLVIHNGKDAKSTVGVILEAKKPANKGEMLKPDNLNSKAFQELVLYYLRERITGKNLELKNIVASNIYEWFIFDAQVFEKAFAQNKALVKQFTEFEEGRLGGNTTDFFYREIAGPAIEAAKEHLEFTYFDIREYNTPLRNADKADDNKLIALYKLLSPEHLLKLPFANDSNSLDKAFYSELLHIIGLTEIKEGGKKIIERKEPEERNSGSLLENAIIQLDSLDKTSRLDRPSQYGDTNEERLFTVGLELAITWINRILFLKLLEAQLITYHKGDKSYAFLTPEKIHDYDDLNSLFFSVLAKKAGERNDDVREVFAKVPYLNSSLFEPTEMEHTTIFISNLRNERTLPVLPGTVLKSSTGKKRTGELDALTYIFEFLNAYDFSSEGSEEIQEDNKRLINASVLGLIFEKINGYKDGSFFTPGFITMYMCRETIRRAVEQKFREAGYKLPENAELSESFDALYDQIEDRNEANRIINSLKICDPAVGSGHFLVSALNEMIAIKSDLKVLQDREGRRLKEYQVEVVNDELMVTDEDGELFEYLPGSKESQRIQEMLFHEKQTIIENCLFGVDINPNSVKICRLRLWIELLKSAYYKQGTEELETLPNIDINIKTGNSLISRFGLDADIKQALKKSKWSIDSYRMAVQTYREAKNKEEKREMERLINDIKSDFRTEINKNDPKLSRLYKLNGELTNLTTQQSIFGMTASEKKEWTKKVEKLTAETKKLETEIQEIKSNKIYENAFEWRFEFPEVLNEQGEFVGFDVVIGNPPYIRQEQLGLLKDYLRVKYVVYVSGGDVFSYFYELSHSILKGNGSFTFINNTFDKTTAGKALREFTSAKFNFKRYIDFTEVVVFEEATTYPIILMATKSSEFGNFKFLKYLKQNFGQKELLYDESSYIAVDQTSLTPSAWNFFNSSEQKLLTLLSNHNNIREVYGKCYYGIKTALNEAFITDQNLEDSTVVKNVFDGKDLKKWITPKPFKKLIVFKSKSTRELTGESKEADAFLKMKELYPRIMEHLSPFVDAAKKRYDKGEFWWELRNCAYYDLFEGPKIIFPNLQNLNKFSLDKSGTYLNAPAVFLPSDSKYLLGVLNSKVVWHFLKSICVVRSGGYIEVKPQYFEQIPIPKAKPQQIKIIEEKVSQIQTLKREDLKSDIAKIESEIDRLVYELFGLTAEEVRIVEGREI